MRPTVIGPVLAVLFAVTLPATTPAQQRTITLDVIPDKPAHLPPDTNTPYLLLTPPPPPISLPSQPAPPPQSYPPSPLGYCPTDCSSDGSYVWLDADLLYWWVRSQPRPPLVTQSPLGTPRSASGVLDQPGTVALVGAGGGVNGGSEPGGRLTAGFWIDECHTFGLQGDFFRVGSQLTVSDVSSAAEGRSRGRSWTC